MNVAKLASVDSRVVGVSAHAIDALAAFTQHLKSAKESFDQGWGVYDEESEALLDSAQAALMFLHPDLAATISPFVDAADMMSTLATDDYERGMFARTIVRGLVATVLGASPPKAKPAPVAVPKADFDADAGVPF